MLSQELSTLRSSMAIENGKVTYWYLVIQFQVLYYLIRILHAITLPYVRHNPHVKPLHLKFKSPNPETIIWH